MYLTIEPNEFTTTQTIKKSEFITNLARVHSEEEAQAFIARIKKEHNKANHNVYAYVLGDNDEIQRMSDDGEPSGTAGVPILEVITRNEVHDVVAVVTRYFGGIKLGAGGLIRAYAGSAAQALQEVGFVQRIPQRQITAQIQYPNFDQVQYWLKDQIPVEPQIEYTDQVTLTFPVDEERIEEFTAALTNLVAGQIEITVGDEILAEVPFSKSEE